MNNLENKLTATLKSLMQVLSTLALINGEEQAQLMTARLDSRRLISLSEDKQALLVTVEFLEQLRSQQEAQLQQSAPYGENSELSHYWQQITALSQQLVQENHHTGLLLAHQLTWTDKVLNLLAPLQSQHFYGPDGHPVQKVQST